MDLSFTKAPGWAQWIGFLCRMEVERRCLAKITGATSPGRTYEKSWSSTDSPRQ